MWTGAISISNGLQTPPTFAGSGITSPTFRAVLTTPVTESAIFISVPGARFALFVDLVSPLWAYVPHVRGGGTLDEDVVGVFTVELVVEGAVGHVSGVRAREVRHKGRVDSLWGRERGC
eukprot:sb/3476368/